jgi:hypothetical protein
LTRSGPAGVGTAPATAVRASMINATSASNDTARHYRL